MDESVVAAVSAAALPAVKLSYGTAGFRSRAANLDAIFIRVGCLAALRAAAGGAVVGVMVTASHNPVGDNGVKLVDVDGGMLVKRWEEVGQPPPTRMRTFPPPTTYHSHIALPQYACELAEPTLTAEAVPAVLRRICAAEGVDPAAIHSAVVHVAADTRPSSPALVARVVAGVRAVGATVVDHGLLTTPQLHHIVRVANLIAGATPASAASDASAPVLFAGFDMRRYQGEAGYYAMLRDGFDKVLAATDRAEAVPADRGRLVIDGAHGVGGPKVRRACALHPLTPALTQFVTGNDHTPSLVRAGTRAGCRDGGPCHHRGAQHRVHTGGRRSSE